MWSSSMNNLERYKQISKQRNRIPEKIDSFIPTPSEKDYERGYINRCFIQKTNDKSSVIYEVNPSRLNYYTNKSTFVGVVLKWRISGKIKKDDLTNINEKTVKESNRISIQLVSNKIPNLKLYLPNLQQFYKS